MAVPDYDHIVVVVEENHDYSQIIGSSQAPYINSLAAGGELLTNYDAIGHPSEPNYFALYAGSTFGITDDNHYSEPDPTLATILEGAGKTFTGYVEGGDSSYDHNPWESFPEGFSVEKDFSTFPSSTDFASLPTVSFVIPNVDDDMHTGTIQQADTWLQTNIGAYAQWATSHNSLLVVTWDENDGTDDGNHVATILYGADVTPGITNATSYNHYDLLSTLLATYGLTGPNNAATAPPIDGFSSTGASLAGTIQLSAATEGAALPVSTPVASFTDADTADTAAGFAATISWGDGTSSAGTISGGNGRFTVDGGHVYADEGSDPIAVAITRTADATTITPTGTVVVAEGDVLTPHAASLAATAGQALSNVVVATFTDSDTANSATDFGAGIAWGDSTSSAGAVKGANGTFTVTGSHSFASPGTDAVNVTLTDDAPGTATATANSSAVVTGDSLAGTIQLSAATEGAALPAGTPVASFTDANTADTAGGFAATISWGDGTSSAGTISGGNGTFTVDGGHVYADEGSDPITVAITRTADATTITPSGTVVVAEGDVLTPHAASLAATAGQALSNATVATFTDSDTAISAADFGASIAWGDGTSSAGAVKGANGTFTVTGSHSFASPGTDAVTVTLTDDTPGTATATAQSSAVVAGAGSGRTISSRVTGPVTMTAADTPLSITSTGGVVSSGARVDGIDGPGSTPASIANAGGVTSAGGYGIRLVAGGTITNAAGGTITGAGYGIYGSAAPVTVSNAGGIASTGGAGVYLSAGGSVTNAAGGSIAGSRYGVIISGGAGEVGNAGAVGGGVYLARGGSLTNDAGAALDGGNYAVLVAGGAGTVTNAGRAEATRIGVYLSAGGSITNTADGSISGSVYGVKVSGGRASLTNAGSIGGGGVYFADGGSVSNSQGGTISGAHYGVFVGHESGTVVNAATITSTSGTGLYLQAGGSVTNDAGASIAGASYGIWINGGSGTITNSGTLSGGSYSVLFDGGGPNRLVVAPAAVFKGAVAGVSGAANTLELAGGNGSISGLSEGAGTVVQNGNWSFSNFQNISVDAGGEWTLNGGGVRTLANNGTVDVAGSLDLTAGLDPASSGLVQLANASVLEVSAAPGTQARIAFLGSSELAVDAIGSFGVNVGTSQYAGSQLEGFGAGDTVDLKDFKAAGAIYQFDPSDGILQIANGAGQHASLSFQVASLGAGAFQIAADGHGGSLVLHM